MLCRGLRWIVPLVVVGFLLSASAPKAQAQVAGTYRCESLKVGKRELACTSPPLVLFPDGCYQIWGEQGTYSIQGRWVVLSQSHKRGPGQIQSGRHIVFQFRYKGKKYEVRFKRQYDMKPGWVFI